MKIEEQIRQIVSEAVEALGLDVGDGGVELEHPADETHGDYASNVAMVAWGRIQDTASNAAHTSNKKQAKNPRELAEKIVGKIQDTSNKLQVLEKVEVAGPGFINFYLSKEFLIEELKNVNEVYGKSQQGKGKKVIVEYSSPNIAKPFTIGHLRSTIIGDAVANVLEFAGFEVMRDNHLGDWGTQFGKQIYAIKNLGRPNELEELEKDPRPVKRLVELYVKFHEEAEKDASLNDRAREWFKKLEDGNSEARELWQKCIDWSWKEFNVIYDQLGIKFSQELAGGRGLGESFFEDKMGSVIDELTETGLLKEGKEGARLVFFPDKLKMPAAMIIKGDGATLYHTRDLATDKYRLEQFKPDVIINEVGAEQELYFRQLYEMERMLGWYQPGQRVHIKHGLYRFAEGKMSTRKGNVIWLEEVLEEAVKRAEEAMKQAVKGNDLSDEEREGLAKMVGIGALKWNDLKSSPEREVVFDWDTILNMQGNSGPYVQYTYARTQSVLGKVAGSGQSFDTVQGEQVVGDSGDKSKASYMLPNTSYELNDEEMAVLRWLYRFPEFVERGASEYAPHLVAGYVYELAQRYNGFYNKHSILNVEDTSNKEQVTSFRLAMTAGVGEVLKTGLGLLGIGAPRKM